MASPRETLDRAIDALRDDLPGILDAVVPSGRAAVLEGCADEIRPLGSPDDDAHMERRFDALRAQHGLGGGDPSGSR